MCVDPTVATATPPTSLTRVLAYDERGVGSAALEAAEGAGLGVARLGGFDLQARIKRGVREADATIWIGSDDAPGWMTCRDACRAMGSPRLDVDPLRDDPAAALAFLEANAVETLHVVGPREFQRPGTEEAAGRFLVDLFGRPST